MGSCSCSCSITNTSNNCSSGGSNNNANSSSNIGSRPFIPGRAPQPPPQMFMRVGGSRWVPQKAKNPQPLINEVWSTMSF